jgi:hypothetical protein
VCPKLQITLYARDLSSPPPLPTTNYYHDDERVRANTRINDNPAISTLPCASRRRHAHTFTAFRPSGVRAPIDGGGVAGEAEAEELDRLGIPTIALRMKHVADTSEKKKKRKKGGAAGAQSVQVTSEGPETWWEVWEELEDVKAYNVCVRCFATPSGIPCSFLCA